MAKVVIEPTSRMATPGSSTSFKVYIEGSGASTVCVLPCKEADDYRVQQLAEGGLEAPVGDGELTLTIASPAKASMA